MVRTSSRFWLLTIRQVSQMPRRELERLALKDAAARGSRWVIGGPTSMSKDELVAYLVRETELVRS